MSEHIARTRVALYDIKPEIWRRVEVPLDLSLKGLHDVIQAVMGWQDCHLFEFTIGEKVYGLPDPEWDHGRKVRQAKLAKLESFIAQGVRTFDYVYDMGDNWQHAITVETVALADPNQKYPCFIDGERHAPPEDVGGTPGYYEFLETVSNPRHPGNRRMLEWFGGPFDPDDIDTSSLRQRLSGIAKQRNAAKTTYYKRTLN